MLSLLSHALVRSLAETALAFDLDLRGVQALCNTSIPCVGWGGGAAGASLYILVRLVDGLKIVLIAAAVIFAFLAAVNMVLHPMDENAVKEARMSYTYIIIGAAIVIVAEFIVNTFAVGYGPLIVNAAPFQAGTLLVIRFILGVMGIGLVANVVIQAFRILTSQGEQAQLDKARKRLIAGFVGLALILLSPFITGSLDVHRDTGGNAAIVGHQIIGIARFILTLLGGGALVTMIAAGITTVLSGDEALKDKAKTLAKVSLIALVASVIAHPLLNLLFENLRGLA